MGTSSRYGGPSPSSALVPSGLQGTASEEPPRAPTEPTPGGGSPAPGSGPDKGDAKEKPASPQSRPKPLPPLPPPGKPGRFHSARTNFTKFAKSTDRAYLRKAVSDYVRKGTG